MGEFLTTPMNQLKVDAKYLSEALEDAEGYAVIVWRGNNMISVRTGGEPPSDKHHKSVVRTLVYKLFWKDFTTA